MYCKTHGQEQHLMKLENQNMILLKKKDLKIWCAKIRSSKKMLRLSYTSPNYCSLCEENPLAMDSLTEGSGTLQWRHNERNGVSNHQRLDCLLSRLFRLRSKKTSKLRVTGLCEGNSPVSVNSPHKWPVTRKMFPFDDVIMNAKNVFISWLAHGHISVTLGRVCRGA